MCPIDWGPHHEACLHSFEQSALHVNPSHCVLADHVETIADSHCLRQPVGPAQRALLQSLELATLHRQHTMQLCLHTHTHPALSSSRLGVCFLAHQKRRGMASWVGPTAAPFSSTSEPHKGTKMLFTGTQALLICAFLYLVRIVLALCSLWVQQSLLQLAQTFAISTNMLFSEASYSICSNASSTPHCTSVQLCCLSRICQKEIGALQQLTADWVRVPVLSKAMTSAQAPSVRASLKFRVMLCWRIRHLPTVPWRTIMRGSPGGHAYISMSRMVLTWKPGIWWRVGALMK